MEGSESEMEYTVERITNARMVRGKLQYRVRWEFFGAEDDTWEPAENLCNAAAKVEQFEASKQKKKNKKNAGRGAPAEKKENRTNRAAKLKKAPAAANGGEKFFDLLGLPELVFVLLCTDCGLHADLGRLGLVCRQLREWTESAAQVLVARKRGYRSVQPRSSESWAFLHFLQSASMPPVPVAAGDEHTLAVVGEKVFAFGSDSERQLGLGDSEDIVEVSDSGSHFPGPREIMRLEEQRVVTVAAGGSHSVCLTVDGELFAWGYANSGQLGLDFGTAQVTSKSVVAAPRRVTAGFPANTVVSCAAAGGHHTACVTARGELFTWGDGGKGQLGHGDERKILFAPRTMRCSSTPRRVAALLEQRIVGLDCGSCTTAAITATNELFMCGELMGTGVVTPRTVVTVPALVAFPSDVGVRQVSCGHRHFAAVGLDGVLYTWGDGRLVELGHSLGELVLQPRAVPGRLHTRLVSCGERHTACVTTAGALWTWGSHGGAQDGQLGHGNWGDGQAPQLYVFKPKRVWSLPGGAAAQVTALSCGDAHTVAVLASGELCTFGNPDDGRLGRVHGVDGFGDPIRAPGVVEMPA